MGRFEDVTVAIDGSLFEKYPHYADRMKAAMRELMGCCADNIKLEQGIPPLIF